MRRKTHKETPDHFSGGYEHLTADADFYAGAPSEKPLFNEKRVSIAKGIHKTGRHKAIHGQRKETIDPREKMALLAILKTVLMIFFLGMAVFMLKKGIRLYEESIWAKNQDEFEVSPVLQEVPLIEEFNIENQDSRKIFAERIKIWKETERLVRSSDALLKRDNLDQAINRCQDALRLDPSHMGALERLGSLYLAKGMTVESINSYIRVLSIDPSRSDLQENLIQVLSVHGDMEAVVFMSKWYLKENHYDDDIQRYLANALYALEEYTNTVEALKRVVLDAPDDLETLEKLVQTYMKIGDYSSALEALDRLSSSNYRDMNYYHQIAICNAQLGNSTETVQTLGKAAHLFGQNVVIGWIQDPQLDPVREDHLFQTFADRVGGEEFRKWLEKVAKTMDGEEKKGVSPQLTLPEKGAINADP